MNSRVDLITLRVDDLPTARRFYVHDMGWVEDEGAPDHAVYLPVGHECYLALVDDTDWDYVDSDITAAAVKPTAAP